MTKAVTERVEPGANFQSVRVRQAERDQFDEFIARHVAQLLDFAKPYVGRLPMMEKELFLDRALRAAWDTRSEFQPQKENAGLLRWWDTCLRKAALSRKSWTQLYVDDVRRIRGEDLGK